MRRSLGSILVLFAVPVGALTLPVGPAIRSSTASVVPIFVVPAAFIGATKPVSFPSDCGAVSMTLTVITPCDPFSDRSQGDVTIRVDAVAPTRAVDGSSARQTVHEPFVPALLVVGAFAFFSERRHYRARQQRC